MSLILFKNDKGEGKIQTDTSEMSRKNEWERKRHSVPDGMLV